MLTLKIQFGSGLPFIDQVNQLDREFPGLVAGNSLLVSHEMDLTVDLTLKEQDDLTDAQRDWLHLSELAPYIDEYQVIQPENDVEKLAKENERLTTENKIMRRELKMLVEDLREIVDIHGDHDMTTTPTEKLSRMASGIEGMFKKEASNV